MQCYRDRRPTCYPRYCRTAIIAVLLSFSLIGYCLADGVTIAGLLGNPARYDGTHVVVSGVAADVRMRTSRAGNDYETFEVCDQQMNCVRVFTWGHPAVEEGAKITVRGTFSAVRHVGRYTFYNEIEADQ
jgi:hypothetical protein